MSVKNIFYSFIILFLLVIPLYAGTAGLVHAQTSSAPQPIINTSTTPNGASVTVSIPSGYSGKVTATYDGHQLKTSTQALTTADIAQMNAEIAQEQKIFADMFALQQEMFQEMQNMFGFNFGF